MTALREIEAEAYQRLLDRIAELERERDVCIKAWQLADSCTVQERERTAAAEAQIARLTKALQEIARQRTTDEYATMDEGGDFEAGYDGCISCARAVLGET